MKKRYKILAYFSALVLILAVAAFFAATRTKLIEKQVNRSLKLFLEKEYPVKIEVQDISGSVTGGLTITGLTVDFIDKTYPYRILEVEKINIHYKLQDLWNRKWNFSKIEVIHPKMVAKVTADGKFILPKLKKTGALDKVGLFAFKVDDLKIISGDLAILPPDTSYTFEKVNLALMLESGRKGFQFQLDSSNFYYKEKDINIVKLEGKGNFHKNKLKLDNLALVTDKSDLKVSGEINVKEDMEYALSLESQKFDLNEIYKLTMVGLEGEMKFAGRISGNKKGFEGEAVLTGGLFERKLSQVKTEFTYKNKTVTFHKIQGRIFNSPLTGSGTLGFSTSIPSYTFSGTVQNLDIQNIVESDFHTDFSGQVNLTGEGFNPEQMKMDFSVNLDKGKIDEYTFNQASGKFMVTEEKIIFLENFQAIYKNTYLTFQGGLEYSGELNITCQVNFNNLQDFWEQIFIEELSGKGKASLSITGPTQDFNVEGYFESDSCLLYQLFSPSVKATFNLTHYISRPQGSLYLTFLNGSAWTIPYDSLQGIIIVDDDFYTFDSTYMNGKNYLLAAYGTIDAKDSLEQILEFKLLDLRYEGNSVQLSQPARVNLKPEWIEINPSQVSIGAGRVNVSGTISYEEVMNLALDFSNIDISSWMCLMFPKVKITGDFSGQGIFEGSFEHPQISFDFLVKDVNYQGVNMGVLEGKAFYTEQNLKLEDVYLDHRDAIYGLSGNLPLDLSFYSREKRVLDLAYNLNFEAQGNRFSLIHLFLPEVEYLTGDFKSEIIFAGTPYAPILDGRTKIESGVLKIKNVFDPITNLNTEIRLINENVYIDKAEGLVLSEFKPKGNVLNKFWNSLFPQKPRPGVINLNGTVKVHSLESFEYDLYIKGENMPLRTENLNLTALADFALKVQGLTPPLVSGNITIDQLFYREPFGSEVEQGLGGVAVTDAEQLWDWEINIAADNNVWIDNNDLKAEFSGQVNVARQKGEYSLFGSLKTIRGNYYLPGTTFKIERGSLNFDDIATIDPGLDFLVSADVFTGSAGYGSSSNKNIREKIQLQITGSLSAPVVGPAPGSPYTKEDILELLTWHRSFSNSDTTIQSSHFQETVLRGLGGTVGGQILGQWAGRFIGVETFEIRPSALGKFNLLDTEITVGKYISNRIYWKYTSRLSLSSGQETGVEYYLNRYLYVEGSRDRNGLFHLGLNFNWEY